MESKTKAWLVVIVIAVILASAFEDCGSCSGCSLCSDTEYDSSDPYYSSNDHNHDGKLTQSEFQDAVGDYLDAHGY